MNKNGLIMKVTKSKKIVIMIKSTFVQKYYENEQINTTYTSKLLELIQFLNSEFLKFKNSIYFISLKKLIRISKEMNDAWS